MFKFICVTNRHLVGEDFLKRIERISDSGADAILLREKDLSADEYRSLAEQTLCFQPKIAVILHTFVECAASLHAKSIHLSFDRFCALKDEEKKSFSQIGVSCHSLQEAQTAEALGASYLTVGHIFPTECKRKIPPRGVPFLETVCRNVKIPVYAIGGISPQNVNLVRNAGASGACLMGAFMQCPDPKILIKTLRHSL